MTFTGKITLRRELLIPELMSLVILRGDAWLASTSPLGRTAARVPRGHRDPAAGDRGTCKAANGMRAGERVVSLEGNGWPGYYVD